QQDTVLFKAHLKENHNDTRLQSNSLLNDLIRAKAGHDSLETAVLERQLDWLVPLYRENTGIGDLSRRLSLSKKWDHNQARLKLSCDSTLTAFRNQKNLLASASFTDSLAELAGKYLVLDDSMALADLAFTRGDLFLINGQTDSAIHGLEDCIKQCDRLDYYSLEGVCYNHLGYIYNTLKSDFLKSERAYLRALACFRKVDHRWRIPYVLTGRIYNFLQLYQTGEAVALINRTQEEFEQLNDSSGIALCKYYLAEALYNNAEYDSAFYYVEQSADLRRKQARRKSQQVSDWAYSVSCRGLINQALEKDERAAGDYRLADSLFKLSGNTQGLHMNLIRWGGYHLNRRNYASARQLFLTVYDNSDSYENNLFSLYGLAVCDYHQSLIEAAVEKLNACINLVELTDRQLPVPEIKTGMLSDKIGFYNLLAIIYIEQYETDSNFVFLDSAFNVIEKSKSRTLVDNLTKQTAPDILLEEDELLQNISIVQRQIICGSDRADSLYAEIARLEDSLHILRINDVSEKDIVVPVYFSIPELQKEITDDRTILVEYLLSEFGLKIFVLSCDTVEVFTPDIEYNRLKALIVAYIDMLHRAPSEAVLAEHDLNTGKELYNILFPEKILSKPDLENIIVVPSSLIHHMPLEALVDSNNHYLVEKYNISYLPSATTGMLLAHRKAPPMNQSMMIFGYSPFAKASVQSEPQTTDSSEEPTNPYANLLPLPYCDSELDNITRLFAPEGLKCYRGATATETNFKAVDFKSVTFVHMAAHGITDERHPNRSAIVLSFEDSEANDGLLQASEISRLNIPARLVFLSACQTGAGRMYPGEGILNLARPFIQAGSCSAVVTGWNINDRFALDLVNDFYEKLLDCDNTVKALAEAKRRALASPRRLYRHPY
ncbi:MAG: CHAT domain-containing protein, partial [Candidatus Zixiibacteriota bacterium]